LDRQTGAGHRLAALDDQRRASVRIGRAVERAGAEVLDDLVETLRQPEDLALAHPLDPELLHGLLDPACGDAGEEASAITDTNACSARRRGCSSQ
jgi:hypothetical protein